MTKFNNEHNQKVVINQSEPEERGNFSITPPSTLYEVIISCIHSKVTAEANKEITNRKYSAESKPVEK